jgi:hypothetical protein
MTYKEYFKQLRNEFATKTDEYIKAEKRLTEEPNGFVDKKVFEDYVKAKVTWQNAANSYNSFIDYAKQHQINPDDKMNL